MSDQHNIGHGGHDGSEPLSTLLTMLIVMSMMQQGSSVRIRLNSLRTAASKLVKAAVQGCTYP
jgi:hypothetical protein